MSHSGLVHTVVGTAAKLNDVTQASQLMHDEYADVFADAGCPEAAKRRGEPRPRGHSRWTCNRTKAFNAAAPGRVPNSSIQTKELPHRPLTMNVRTVDSETKS
jgi:IS5 family transposase